VSGFCLGLSLSFPGSFAQFVCCVDHPSNGFSQGNEWVGIQTVPEFQTENSRSEKQKATLIAQGGR